MRRVVTVLLSMGLISAMLAGPVSAASITRRHDQNEKSVRVMDIRRVWTDVGATNVLLGIGAWRAFGSTDGRFLVYLDTKGSLGFDRFVEFTGLGFVCLVYEWDTGEQIGTRDARRPSNRDVACRFPAAWLDIQKTVRFAVHTRDTADHDRAPNHHFYVSL